MSIHQSFDPTKATKVSAAIIASDATPFEKKEFALIQLQRIGFKVGQIKVADFERRDNEDDERHKTKNKRELQDWLDRMSLNDFARQLSSHVRDLDDSSAKTEDAINDAINKLQAVDGKGQDVEPAIDTLKTARTQIREQRSRLSKISEQLSKARNWNDMRNVATNVQNATTQIANTQQNAQQFTNNLNRAVSSISPSRSHTSGSGASAGLSLGLDMFGDDKEDGGNNKFIIRINLMSIKENEDRNTISAYLRRLSDRYGNRDVREVAQELKNETGQKKYDTFVSILRGFSNDDRRHDHSGGPSV